MSQPIIVAENLGKQYRVGLKERSTGSMREALGNLLKAPWRRLRSIGEKGTEEDTFWALRDVSFAIEPGEVVGIIGRNGAGKSTVLKVLSRVVSPTEGCVRLRGRVGSLLEVGTGFHVELTGRENIYLNGSILGMSRSEINRKFDEIVEFAGIGKFLDTPVKRYSSGMYVRLAFAVAAHLEPDILIVDEVLAVGDATFQKKCMGKMEEVAGHGRTVLFVSHNMDSINRLCSRGLLLNAGRLVADGSAAEISHMYLHSDAGTTAHRVWEDLAKAPHNHVAGLRSVRICDESGATNRVVDIRRPVGIEVTFEVFEDGHRLVPGIRLHNEDGVCLCFLTDQQEATWGYRPRPPGVYTSTAWVPGNFLSEGLTIVTVNMNTWSPLHAVHFQEDDAVAFQVVDSHEGDSVRGEYGGVYPGVVRPLVDWTTEYHGDRTPALA
jgi:lipopolysaccharide transport system ATP-binding protein